MEIFANNFKYYLSSYQKELFDYLLKSQLLSEDTFKLFVNQFRIHSDDNNGWRGEFWGKTMRGACLAYKFSKNNKLYKVITNTVKDLISIKDVKGRISSYPVEKEFTYWDVWSRKYVMLGLLYYYDICKSESLKSRVTKSLCRQADCIIKHVGEGKNQISIYDTSNIYGSMNSSSILSPMVSLYKITKNEKYLRFAKYIVDTGLAGTFNLIDASLDENLMPYQFKETKAYEMMSCLSGLLEYYHFDKQDRYLKAAIKFIDKLIASDYTVVGCAGCNTEFLDNAKVTQTKYCEDVCQETCVTVTLIDLCTKLFALTKDEKYISIIERSTYNSLYGAFNNEEQSMKDTEALIWLTDDPIHDKHEPYPFDSYSPLYRGRRGHRVGGYMKMQDGRSYGCCAAIGGFAFALSTMVSVYQENKSLYFINLYNKEKVVFDNDNNQITFNINANVYTSNFVKINVKANNEKLSIKLRIPSWMKNPRVFIDDVEVKEEVKNGYLIIEKLFSNNIIKIKFTNNVKKMILNDKAYFLRGPIVLSSDSRFKNTLLDINKDDVRKIKFKKVKNELFKSNLCMEGELNNKKYMFVDYSQAGKNFDDKNSLISVFFDIK